MKKSTKKTIAFATLAFATAVATPALVRFSVPVGIKKWDILFSKM